MSDECTLIARHGWPRVVEQALRDFSLPPMARLMMFHLADRLDIVEFREVKGASLANEMRIHETTAGHMLTVLVERGYLDESARRKPRAFRLLWSRRLSVARAA